MVSKLKDDLMATSNTYFGLVNEQVSFLYHTLDHTTLDIFKVICNAQLVDDEKVSPFAQPRFSSVVGA